MVDRGLLHVSHRLMEVGRQHLRVVSLVGCVKALLHGLSGQAEDGPDVGP
jgi:hypothetical protein